MTKTRKTVPVVSEATHQSLDEQPVKHISNNTQTLASEGGRQNVDDVVEESGTDRSKTDSSSQLPQKKLPHSVTDTKRSDTVENIRVSFYETIHLHFLPRIINF